MAKKKQTEQTDPQPTADRANVDNGPPSGEQKPSAKQRLREALDAYNAPGGPREQFEAAKSALAAAKGGYYSARSAIGEILADDMGTTKVRSLPGFDGEVSVRRPSGKGAKSSPYKYLLASPRGGAEDLDLDD